MKTKDKISIARQVAESLMGSCNSIDDILRQYELNENLVVDSEFCATIDDLVFLCPYCGWWSEAGDYADDEICEAAGESVCSDHYLEDFL